MQPPLSYREVCSLPPACPPSPLVFHLHTPMPHPNCREVFGRVPSLGFPALMPTVPWQDSPQRSWHTGTPGSCHAPPAPAALSITQSGQGTGGGTPKVVGVGGGGHPPLGFAPRHGACRMGGTSEPRPPRPLPGESLAAGAGTGTSLGGRWPPSTSGKGTIPGHFFFGRPRVPPSPHPPSSSRARARGHN